MLRQSYLDFIEKFEHLTPYQLDNFCNIVYRHYQALLLQNSNQGKVFNLSQGDVKDILIRSMQEAHIDFAEETLREAEYDLQLIKSRIYPKEDKLS